MATAGIKTAAAEGSVRQRLLEGAAELFTQKGYAATTVREIVASAGVTKPALYYYFQSKEGIYLELMREAFAKLDALLDASLEEKGSATEKLLRLSDRAFSLLLENIKVVRVMYAIYYGPHQGAPFFDFDAYHLKFQQAIRLLVDEGIRRGEFRRENAEGMAWAIMGAINVAMEVHLGHSEMAIGREGLARILKLIFQGISAGKARPTTVSPKPAWRKLSESSRGTK
ncbi:MAG: TetR/AcrR family transcriptional regulator [Deltaproteobacteria bacterium]|nr:TetR/AcrR family transcriptional regulator [Deltaproteobacteria bacterium]